MTTHTDAMASDEKMPDNTSRNHAADPALRGPRVSRVVRRWLATLFIFSGFMLLWFATRGLRRDAADMAPHADHGQSTAVSDPVPRQPADFVLMDQMANRFSADSLRGKYWLASFFYGTCPSVCPQMNSRIEQLQHNFASRGLEFVSITCDPANDNVTSLYSYSKRFNADPTVWHFLTGEMDEILEINKNIFQVSVANLSHSDRLILMGPDGLAIGTYRSRDPAEYDALRLKLDHLLPPVSETTTEQP